MNSYSSLFVTMKAMCGLVVEPTNQECIWKLISVNFTPCFAKEFKNLYLINFL